MQQRMEKTLTNPVPTYIYCLLHLLKRVQQRCNNGATTDSLVVALLHLLVAVQLKVQQAENTVDMGVRGFF